MAIEKFHAPGCAGGDCKCPWRLDYRPEGMAGHVSGSNSRRRRRRRNTLTETRHKASLGEYIAPAKVPTFKSAAELWYASKLDRRPAHVADLRSRLDKHILPRLGEFKLDRMVVL